MFCRLNILLPRHYLQSSIEKRIRSIKKFQPTGDATIIEKIRLILYIKRKFLET